MGDLLQACAGNPVNTIVGQLAQYGPLALLFGVVVWLGYLLAIRSLSHLVEIERMRSQASESQAKVLLAHAEALNAAAMEQRRQHEEIAILLRRMLHELDHWPGADGG